MPIPSVRPQAKQKRKRPAKRSAGVTVAKPLKVKVDGFGSVTVAHRFVDDEWRCTALQFDIVGCGPTKVAAFQEMQELVDSYLIHVLRARRKTSFFNPSDREEWDAPDRSEYHVIVSVADGKPIGGPSLRFDKLRSVGRRVRSFELIPA